MSNPKREAVLKQWAATQSLSSPPSLREFARSVGVAPSTLQRWTEEEDPESAGSQVPFEASERQVASLCLSKAQLILSDIELADPKGQQEKANAAAKLLEKYLTLVGEPESRREVIHSSGRSEAELDALLADLGLGESVGLEMASSAEDVG